MSLINFRSVIYEKYCCVYSNVNGGQLQNLFNSLHKLEKSSYVLFIRELPSVSQFTFLQVSFAQSYSPNLSLFANLAKISQKFRERSKSTLVSQFSPNIIERKQEWKFHPNFFQPSTLQNSLVKQPKSGRSTQQSLKESIGGANDPRAKWWSRADPPAVGRRASLGGPEDCPRRGVWSGWSKRGPGGARKWRRGRRRRWIGSWTRGSAWAAARVPAWRFGRTRGGG